MCWLLLFVAAPEGRRAHCFKGSFTRVIDRLAYSNDAEINQEIVNSILRKYTHARTVMQIFRGKDRLHPRLAYPIAGIGLMTCCWCVTDMIGFPVPPPAVFIGVWVSPSSCWVQVSLWENMSRFQVSNFGHGIY